MRIYSFYCVVGCLLCGGAGCAAHTAKSRVDAYMSNPPNDQAGFKLALSDIGSLAVHFGTDGMGDKLSTINVAFGDTSWEFSQVAVDTMAGMDSLYFMTFETSNIGKEPPIELTKSMASAHALGGILQKYKFFAMNGLAVFPDTLLVEDLASGTTSAYTLRAFIEWESEP